MRPLVFISLTLVGLIASACSATVAAPTSAPASTPTKAATPAGQPTQSTGGKVKQYSSAPPMTIDQSKQYLATLDTNVGKIVVQLLPKEAPLAVNSFVFLAREKYYDGVKFHRVVPGFVIQSGDPTGTGAGSPGYRFADEKVVSDYEKGTLAMANSGPNTNGSQFFVTLADLRARLPKNHTIFGRVTEGLEVVDKIGAVPVKVNPATGERSVPEQDVLINTITIEEK